MTYKVYSVDWLEDEPTEIVADNPKDACQEWCELMDGHGNFVDSYPQDHELRVVSPDGSEARFLISTDFEPSFYVAEKKQTA